MASGFVFVCWAWFIAAGRVLLSHTRWVSQDLSPVYVYLKVSFSSISRRRLMIVSLYMASPDVR